MLSTELIGPQFSTSWLGGTHAEVIFGESVIYSCDGFHHKDPLTCFFFFVVHHTIIKRIADKVPDLLLNVCYLDDGTLVGKLDALRKAVNIIWASQMTLPLH